MDKSWLNTSRALIVAATLVLVLSIPQSAAAQLGIIPKFRIKAGIFLPQDSSLSNVTSNTWMKFGADVSLPLGIPLLSGGTRVGIDYVVHGSSNIVPITLTSVIQPSLGVTSPVYIGGGIGLWTGHIKGAGTSTRFGARLLGGVDIGKSTFFELQYDFVDKLGGVRADGFSFLVGMKF